MRLHSVPQHHGLSWTHRSVRHDAGSRLGDLQPRHAFGVTGGSPGQMRFRRACAPHRAPCCRRRATLRISMAASNGNGAVHDWGRGTSAASARRPPRRLRGPLDDQYVWMLVWQQKRHVAAAVLALLCCTACNLASPLVTGNLFEILAGRQPLARYPRFLGALAAMYVAEPLLTRVYIRNACQAGEKVLAALRMELFRVLLMERVEFFDRHGAAELTALLSSELDAVRAFVFSNVSRDRGARACLEAAGSVTILAWLSWRLGPILAALVVATAGVAALYKRQTKAVERTNAAALAAMASVASQAFAAISTVRSFAGEGLERERFGEHVRESYRSGLGFARAKANLESLNRGAIHASLVGVYGLGGWLVAQGLMPLRALLSAVGYTFSLVFATQGVVLSFSEARRVAAAFRRIREVLNEMPVDPSMSAALPPGAWWEAANSGVAHVVTQPYGPAAGDAAVRAARGGALELRDVHFSYPLRPDVPVLRGLDLALRAGSVTALVGHSGAGKSTVAALLSRFYEPGAGGLFLGGRPAQGFTRGEWARAVALVAQEPELFAGTIADNVGYGLHGRCSRKAIRAAVEAANAAEFVEALPQGLDTRVGARGALLSGGQRQRIAIARALLKDSPVLILDEATSALDARSEAMVQAAIERLMRGRTVLVIAHRLSTIQAADQIAVISDGRIVELGTNAELVEKGGMYANLVSMQALSLSTT